MYMCVTLLVACGAPADPVKGYEAVWRANCEAIVECVEQAPEEDFEWIEQRAQDCATTGELDAQWAASVRLGVDEGRITYDQDLATECLKSYRKIDCIFMWDDPVSTYCDDYLQGQLECDAMCSIHEECSSGVCRGNTCDCST
jgi:hypothetical protein